MANLEKYKSLLAEVFDTDVANVKEDFSKETVDNWDSIHQLNIIAVLEETFDVMLDPEDIVELTSYEKGIEILKKYDVESKLWQGGQLRMWQ